MSLEYVVCETRKSIRPKGASVRSTSLSPASRNLDFDLLTPQLIVLCLCPGHHSCQFARESFHSFKKYRVNKFDNKQTNERTDEGTGRKYNASAGQSGLAQTKYYTAYSRKH